VLNLYALFANCNTPEPRTNETAGALAILLVLAAGCGTGTDGKPVAPPTSPAPPPAAEPPPEPPGQPSSLRVVDRGQTFIQWAWEPVEGATGYQAHAFPDGTSPSERPPLRMTVEPTFRADGLEPGAVMGFFVQAIRQTAGGTAVGPWSPMALASTPRACTDERERAATFSLGAIAVDEWDGTPFRFDIVRGFPDSMTEAELARLLEAVALADRKIEDQLGYRILEMGEVIPWPAGPSPPGCALPRERGQLQGYYSTAREHGAAARPQCAEFFYTPGLVAE